MAGCAAGLAAKTLVNVPVIAPEITFIITLMIFTTTAPQLPKTRLSPVALLFVSVVHIALFWLLLQTAPVQRVVRETVVMLNLPITQPLPKPPPKKVITLPKPPEPVKPIKPNEKPVVVTKTITKPVEPLPVPPPKPVEPPKPIEPPKPVEPPKPIEPPKPLELPKPVEKPVVLPKPPEKVVEAKPVEVVVSKELPKEPAKEAPKETLKPVVAELPPAPVSTPAPVPSPAPVTSAVAPAAEPAKASAPSLASAPAVASNAPAVTPSTGKPTTAITTNSTPSGSNASPAAPAAVAAPSNSGALPLGGLIANPSDPLGLNQGSGGSGKSPYQRKGRWAEGELAEMSRKQLNPNKRPENFEIEFEKAKKEDCLHPTNPSLSNGLRMLNRDCPK